MKGNNFCKNSAKVEEFINIVSIFIGLTYKLFIATRGASNGFSDKQINTK